MGQRPGIALSYSVARSRGWDPMLLWYRLAAVAPVQPVAWELPYDMGAALKKKKKKILHLASLWKAESNVSSTWKSKLSTLRLGFLVLLFLMVKMLSPCLELFHGIDLEVGLARLPPHYLKAEGAFA